MPGHVLGRPLYALKIALHVWGSGPHQIRGSLGLSESISQRHLDRFSCFTKLTAVTDGEPDRPTDHVATPPVPVGRIATDAMRPHIISEQRCMYLGAVPASKVLENVSTEISINIYSKVTFSGQIWVNHEV